MNGPLFANIAQLPSTTHRPMTPESNRRDKKILPPVAPLPQSDTLGSRVSPEQLEQSRKMALAAVKAAAENRGQDIILLDLTEQTALFDFFVIATGSSRRQLAAMSSEIDRVLKYDLHERKMSVAGYEESRWIVLDYGSIVVHLFDEETREFYDLESLWADGKEVDISAIVAEASAQMAKLTD
jgi:ribosome-associated protein